MQKLITSLIVFISGFVILSFEILGSRILAPIVGTTAPVWGALLAVIIAGSAVGYYIGGIMSDARVSSPKYILVICAIAAGWIAALAFAKNILFFIHPTSYYGAVALLCGVGLFFIPTMLLSSATAFLTKRSTADIQHIGVTAGSLYAIATIGSVVGVFGMSYVIIPLLTIPSIIYLMALLVLIAALLGFGLKTYEPLKTNQ